jgi:hypothetical protein
MLAVPDSIPCAYTESNSTLLVWPIILEMLNALSPAVRPSLAKAMPQAVEIQVAHLGALLQGQPIPRT